MKNASDGLIDELDTAEEGISEHKDKAKENNQTEMQRENK